jgi:hypothetical protein
LSNLEDKIQDFIWQIDTSSENNDGELQIPYVVSKNLVCVDECLYFQEDQGQIYEFPYTDLLFEHCCNEELESVIEHREDSFHSSEEEK